MHSFASSRESTYARLSCFNTVQHTHKRKNLFIGHILALFKPAEHCKLFYVKKTSD